MITVSDATKRRAESVINDRTIDPQWRTIIRFALELNDPFVAELVSRAEAREDIVNTFESMRPPVRKSFSIVIRNVSRCINDTLDGRALL
jgi:hypothetical protein